MSAGSDIDTFVPQHPVKRGEPTWDIALLFPPQGEWTEEEYLDLDANQLIEFVDGCLEFLPASSIFHQRIVQLLYEVLHTWVIAHALGGEVFMAPLRVRTLKQRIRQPDAVYLRPRRIVNIHRPPHGADLAVEVVSPGKVGRKRDLETKRAEYAKSKIEEYWIVDPTKRKITVLVLDGGEYRVHGEHGAGQQAASASLPGFRVDVADLFAAGEKPATA